jgi:LuxR family transcriptional regulator, maltose regulon positive regulatory protein
MPSVLLLTKLFPPPVHSGLVSRPRLVNRVLEGRRLGRKLILVSAPPGFGKTTLVSAVIQQAGCRVAWLSLDGADNDPIRFWRYLIGALRRLYPDLGEFALAMLEANQPPPVENVLTSLINDLAVLPNPFILVLDDYHVIESSLIHTGVNFFIDHLPQQVTLILTTRADPPLSLARRRGRMEMTEIRAVDLRFLREEAVQFLNSLAHLDIPAKELDILLLRTEGWAAGLQLAALALQSISASEDPGAPAYQLLADFISSFAGDDHYIGDYLVEEVLLRQPHEIQDFLLLTSIFDRFCAGLCAAVVDGLSLPSAQEMLSRLDHANLFLVPLDNRQEWYRYHRLFAELLQRQLTQARGGEVVKSLHQRASRWFELTGLWNDAVDHALLAGEEVHAVDLVERHAVELFERSEMPAVREWILRLPERLIYPSISLCISWAWAAISTAHEEEGTRAVSAIERALGVDEFTLDLDRFPTQGLASGFALVLVNLVILRSTLDIHTLELRRSIERTHRAMAYLHTLTGEEFVPIVINFNCVGYFNLGACYQMLGDSTQALDAFENSIKFSDLSLNPHIQPMAISHLAQIYTAQGKLTQAYETYQVSLRNSAEKGEKPSPLSCILHSGLGLLALERNELEEAQAQFIHCLELGIPWNAWEALIPAYMGLARLHYVRNEVDVAIAYLDQANLSWERTHNRGPLLEFQAWRALIQGDSAAMAACVTHFEQERPLLDNALVYIAEDVRHLRVELWLRLGRLEKASEILENVRVSAEKGERWGVIIYNLVLHSVLYVMEKNSSAALVCLERALTLAEPGGYLRVFLNQGEFISPLLVQFVANPTIQPNLAAYARRIIAEYQKEIVFHAPGASAGSAVVTTGALKPARGVLVEPLTERELDVLRLIAQGLTNSEISARLVISSGTVKTHTNNLYSKLDVNSRSAAAARARELGIIE